MYAELCPPLVLTVRHCTVPHPSRPAQHNTLPGTPLDPSVTPRASLSSRSVLRSAMAHGRHTHTLPAVGHSPMKPPCARRKTTRQELALGALLGRCWPSALSAGRTLPSVSQPLSAGDAMAWSRLIGSRDVRRRAGGLFFHGSQLQVPDGHGTPIIILASNVRA